MKYISLFLLLFTIPLFSGVTCASEYQIKDLGVLPDSVDGFASGVNDKAEVVGWCTDADSIRSAFYWSEKTGMKALETPPGYNHSYACAINNDGLIAGFATGPNAGSVACIWQAGKGLVKTGPRHSDAKAINELGQSAGSASNKAAVFSKDFEVKTAADGMAYGMNSLGEVAGAWFEQQRKVYEAFFWSNKTGKVELGPGVAKDVNDSGKIVGYGNGKAVVWDREGNTYTLPTLPGHQFASAEAVNNSGQVAGSLYGKAVVWQADNKITELPNLHKDALSYARAISESGLVAGEVKNTAERTHAVLWQFAEIDTKEDSK